MTLRTFSINELIVVYGGVPLTGFAPGEFMTIEYDNDIFTQVDGADGEVARVKSGMLSATATLRFLQTSPSNDVLSAFLIEDIAINKTQLFIVKDLNGLTILFASQCYIPKSANPAYGTENVNREWRIKIPKMIGFLGGNFRN